MLKFMSIIASVLNQCNNFECLRIIVVLSVIFLFSLFFHFFSHLASVSQVVINDSVLAFFTSFVYYKASSFLGEETSLQVALLDVQT